MFERFRESFAPRRDSADAAPTWLPEALARIDGYIDFGQEFAGASFDGGLYRVHDDQTGPQAAAMMAETFPEYSQRVIPFGYDWLGRQFAIDADRVVGGQPQILLVEPGTGEALEIPFSFSAFHDDELVEHEDAALAVEFFRDWVSVNKAAIPLLRHQCAAYMVPLFVGGHDTVKNLAIADIDVYWSICGQLRRQV